MESNLDLDELVADWTLVGGEPDLVAGKRGSTRLRFALMLKFYGRHGRFPIVDGDLDRDVVDFVAQQVGVDPADFGSEVWSERTARSHQAQIREHFGFRECSMDDGDRAVAWLVEHVCQREQNPTVVREELLAWLRREQLEPPSAPRIERLTRSALHRGERAVTTRVTDRLPIAVRVRLDDLVALPDDDPDVDGADGASVWSLMLAEPGDVSLNSMLAEIDKLSAVRFVEVPAGVVDDVAPAIIERWRNRAAVESPSHLRTHRDELRWSLLATMLVVRERELVDALVDLLIATVHRIGARAGRRVTKELTNVFKKVRGKDNILFSIAQAALDSPDDAVRSPPAGGRSRSVRTVRCR